MRRGLVFAAVTVLAGGIVLSLLLSFQTRKHDPAPKPTQAVYVWQRQWSPEVEAAVGKPGSVVDCFMVLAGEADGRNDTLQFRRMPVAWKALSATGKTVCPVLRAHRLPGIDDEARRGAVIETVATTMQRVADEAREAGTQVSGFQLDYDCATEDLAQYAAFLKGLQERLPDTPLSITALPDWVNRDEFGTVVAPLDYFVLQVHSLDLPRNNEEPATLCDTSKLEGWVKKAATFDRPFYVALPTYGYRLRYGASGELVGVQAEEADEAYRGTVTRELSADPKEIADVVQVLHSDSPRGWQGYAWFRLPVDGDRLNWSWPVLEQVMNGQAPKPDVRAEIRSPQPGLYEVWVMNRGAYRPVKPIRVPVDWRDASLAAHDVLGGFTAEGHERESGMVLVGNAPSSGDEQMVAWYRMQPSAEGAAEALRVEPVEIGE